MAQKDVFVKLRVRTQKQTFVFEAHEPGNKAKKRLNDCYRFFVLNPRNGMILEEQFIGKATGKEAIAAALRHVSRNYQVWEV